MTKNISFSSHFLELACIDWSSLSTLTLSAEMSASGELAIASHRSNQVKKVDSSFSSLRKAEIISMYDKIHYKLKKKKRKKKKK